VTADSICRPATRLPRFSVQILRMGCNTRILSPVLQIRSPQAFLPGSLDLLTCLPVGRGCRSRYYSQVPFWRQAAGPLRRHCASSGEIMTLISAPSIASSTVQYGHPGPRQATY
jgi:hypothetical protein